MTDIPLPSAGVAPLPYRVSYEALEEDEQEIERGLVETLLEISETTFRHSGAGLRSVHAKSHALLRGTIQIPELPMPYAQGMFAKATTLPVFIRISTSPGDLLDDRVSTPRGFALKVVGVSGDRLPGSEGAATQDFLLVNAPAFLAPTAKNFLGSLKLLASTTDRVPKLKRAFSALLRGTEKLIEATGHESGTIKGLGGHPETHPLGETYFSQVPFLYGLYMAKWSVAPASPQMQMLEDAPVDLTDAPNGLRAAINGFLETQTAQWELRVQLCTDIESMPIEDASLEWSQEQSPFVTVARITVEPQIAWDDRLSIQMDDGLAFSPWHGLAAHRPLGSVNRVRRAAYAGSANARSPRGRCPVREPASENLGDPSVSTGLP